MTESLFYLLVWLGIGTPVNLFLRFRGVADLMHEHNGSGDCYIEERIDPRGWEIRKRLICKGVRWGGKPYEVILWLLWTVFWPVPIIGYPILYIIMRGLWTKI